MYLCRYMRAKSYPTLCNPRAVACQVPLSVGFPRQEYWSGLSFASPGDLPCPGTRPSSPDWKMDSLALTSGKPGS